MIIWTIPRIRNANIQTAYMSDPFTIANFNDITLATINKWMLYINWQPKWTSWHIQNWDEINIELYSSNEYETTVSSTITIWSISATFYITTITEWQDYNIQLSNLQKIRIISLFNLILELYSNTPAKEEQFLYTFRSMLMDKLDFMDKKDIIYSTFEYLLNLIESRLSILWINQNKHIAPNCKEYEIKFDEQQKHYYSPNFKNIQHFVNRESIIRYIDSQNPWDCRINTYGTNQIDINNTDPNKHIAPNWKIYRINMINNFYTSPDFIKTVYFDTIQWLRTYININNPQITIRDHSIDNSFGPINHTAPNWKTYKIYKTNKWYMSYRLIKIRYFTTLESIKTFINQNNKI